MDFPHEQAEAEYNQAFQNYVTSNMGYLVSEYGAIDEGFEPFCKDCFDESLKQ